MRKNKFKTLSKALVRGVNTKKIYTIFYQENGFHDY
jgi:hypothetical protein